LLGKLSIGVSVRVINNDCNFVYINTRSSRILNVIKELTHNKTLKV